MNKTGNHPAHDPAAEQFEEQPREAARRKPFVEPAVSAPVDVLEATSFFQDETSGETGDV